jgi:2-polyprenyl-6-methoxyphenol hydroxylase-like FAD-dependent oxidoreductase
MDVIAAGGGPAGLMTAALLDAAGVRAEVRERGSEPRQQSRDTAMHPRTLEVFTMIDAGDGHPISDVLLAQGRRVPNTHCAGLPLLDYRGLDTPFPFTLTLPLWGTEHVPAVYLDARGVRVRHGAEVTTAGQSADEARVQASGAWHTARYLTGTDGAHSIVRKAAGIGFGAHSPSWLARTSNTGRRDAASLAWNGLPRASAARTYMQRTASRSSRP